MRDADAPPEGPTPDPPWPQSRWPRSVWDRAVDIVARLGAGEGLSALFERLATPPERSVGFAIAVVALGAKIAKADGRVTRGEVAAFREVFAIPPEEEANAALVYDLARQDTAGYETYARRVRRMFVDQAEPLVDLMEGLFHIAMADGAYHPDENAFLARVAAILGLSDAEFMHLRARFVPDSERDPLEVLGLPRGSSREEARAAWRALVRETHPDRLAARGLPPEAVRLAEKRLVAVNAAWERIEAASA